MQPGRRGELAAGVPRAAGWDPGGLWMMVEVFFRHGTGSFFLCLPPGAQLCAPGAAIPRAGDRDRCPQQGVYPGARILDPQGCLSPKADP